jgi:hypothetical protein
MSPEREPAAGAYGPQARAAAQRLANAIKERRHHRLSGILDANERRAVYLLEAGRLDDYAAEFPNGVRPWA